MQENLDSIQSSKRSVLLLSKNEFLVLGVLLTGIYPLVFNAVGLRKAKISIPWKIYLICVGIIIAIVALLIGIYRFVPQVPNLSGIGTAVGLAIVYLIWPIWDRYQKKLLSDQPEITLQRFSKVWTIGLSAVLFIGLVMGVFQIMVSSMKQCENGDVQQCLEVGLGATSEPVKSFNLCKAGEVLHCVVIAGYAHSKNDSAKTYEYLYKACNENLPIACLKGASIEFQSRASVGIINGAELLQIGCEKYKNQEVCDARKEFEEKNKDKIELIRVKCDNKDVASCNFVGMLDLYLANYEFAAKALSYYCKEKQRNCNLASAALIKLGNFSAAADIGMKACNETSKEGCYNAACAYCRLGKLDESFSVLQEVIEEKRITKQEMLDDSDLDCLKKDPRFIEILKNYN